MRTPRRRCPPSSLARRQVARAIGEGRTVDRRVGFFVEALSTALEHDEMLMEVELPIAEPRSGACFLEVSPARRFRHYRRGLHCARRRGGTLQRGADRPLQCGRLPIFAADAINSLVGRRLGSPEINEAAELVQGAIDPGRQHPCQQGVSAHVAGVLTGRALVTANERARHGH